MTGSDPGDRTVGPRQPDDPPPAGIRASSAGRWRDLIVAVQFLTRLPLSTAAPDSASLRRATLFFPLVGTAVGCFTAGILWLAGLLWPAWLAVILAIAAELRLTGALHEDGLADFCDGFGGGWSRDQILSILKDSRIGTYGTLGLGLAVALRVGSLSAVVSQYGREGWLYWAAALVASAAVGRWTVVCAMVLIPPIVNRESLTRDVAKQMSWQSFAASGLGAAPAMGLFAYLMPLHALLAVGLVAAALLMIASRIHRRLGGITGDCLGCIAYVSQVLVLLSAAARIP